MVDINPSFVPCIVKPLPFQANEANRPSSVKGKGKAKAEPENGGLLNFFGTFFLDAYYTCLTYIPQLLSKKPRLLAVTLHQ